jgi:chromosome segregation ATPase
LKGEVSAAKYSYQETINSTESKLEELQQTIDKLRASESAMTEDSMSRRQAERDVATEITKVSLRLQHIEINIQTFDSALDAKADRLDSLQMKKQIAAIEEAANGLKGRVDDIAEILETPPGPQRQGLIDALK